MKSIIFFFLITFILSIKINFENNQKEEKIVSQIKNFENFNLLMQSLISIKKDLEIIKTDFNKSIENLKENFFSGERFNYFDEHILSKKSKIQYIKIIVSNALIEFGYDDYKSFSSVIYDNISIIKENNWVHIYFIFNSRKLEGKLNCLSIFVNKNSEEINTFDFIFIKIKSHIEFDETIFLTGIYNAKEGNKFEKENFSKQTIPKIFFDKTDSIIFLYRILTYKLLLNIFSIDFPLFE